MSALAAPASEWKVSGSFDFLSSLRACSCVINFLFVTFAGELWSRCKIHERCRRGRLCGRGTHSLWTFTWSGWKSLASSTPANAALSRSSVCTAKRPTNAGNHSDLIARTRRVGLQITLIRGGGWLLPRWRFWFYFSLVSKRCFQQARLAPEQKGLNQKSPQGVAENRDAQRYNLFEDIARSSVTAHTPENALNFVQPSGNYTSFTS